MKLQLTIVAIFLSVLSSFSFAGATFVPEPDYYGDNSFGGAEFIYIFIVGAAFLFFIGRGCGRKSEQHAQQERLSPSEHQTEVRERERLLAMEAEYFSILAITDRTKYFEAVRRYYTSHGQALSHSELIDVLSEHLHAFDTGKNARYQQGDF